MRSIALGRSRLDIPTKETVTPWQLVTSKKSLKPILIGRTWYEVFPNFLIRLIFLFDTGRYF